MTWFCLAMNTLAFAVCGAGAIYFATAGHAASAALEGALALANMPFILLWVADLTRRHE